MAEWLRPASSTVRCPWLLVGSKPGCKSCPQKEVYMVRRDDFNHVLDSIWRRHLPIFRGQDGRVVKASFFYCEMPMVTRGIDTRLQILSSKEVHIVRRDGFTHVRDSIWRRHLPIF